MFEWDEAKNQRNIKKHGVSFDEAKEALDDPDCIELYDESHSTGEEDRYICIGATVRFLLLSVVLTDREGNTRIISARKADSKERRIYNGEYEKKNS